MKQIEVSKSENVNILTKKQMTFLSPEAREVYRLMQTDPVIQQISLDIYRAGSAVIDRLRTHQNREDIKFWNIINNFNFDSEDADGQDPDIVSLIYNKEWSQDRIPAEGFGAVSAEVVKHECYNFFENLVDWNYDIMDRLRNLGIDTTRLDYEESALTTREVSSALFRWQANRHNGGGGSFDQKYV